MKTTKHHLKVFRDECERLIERWGLTNWRRGYFIDDDVDAHAEVSIKLQDRVVTFFMPTKWKDEYQEPTDEFLKEVALHEVIHVMVGRLDEIAQYRYTSRNEIYEANEELARMIENAVKKGI